MNQLDYASRPRLGHILGNDWTVYSDCLASFDESMIGMQLFPETDNYSKVCFAIIAVGITGEGTPKWL